MTRDVRQVTLIPFSLIAFVLSLGAAGAVIVSRGSSSDGLLAAICGLSLFALAVSYAIDMKAMLFDGAEPSAARLVCAQAALGAFAAQSATGIGYAFGAFGGGELLGDRAELSLIGAGAAVLLSALLIQARIAGGSRLAVSCGLAVTFASVAVAWLGINGFGAALFIIFFLWAAQFCAAVVKVAAVSNSRYTFAVFALTAWITLAVIAIAIFSRAIAPGRS